MRYNLGLKLGSNDTQYTDEGNPKSSDYIFIWEDNEEIVGCILPDGDAIYISIKNGYEDLYKSIVNYAEDNCKPLFKKEKDGFCVEKIPSYTIAHKSLSPPPCNTVLTLPSSSKTYL